MYHGFTNQNSPFLKFSDGKHLHIKKFSSQVRYLKDKYTPISLEQFIEYHKNNKRLPPYSLIVTMDDGYFSNYNLAYPILKKFNIPATIFLTTDFVKNKNFLWTDRIEYVVALAKPANYKLKVYNKELILNLKDKHSKKKSLKNIKSTIRLIPQELIIKVIEDVEFLLENKLSLNNFPQIYLPLGWNHINEMLDLISIGGHTHTHTILTKHNPKNIKKELSLSKKIIENNIKIKSLPFSYPNGTAKDFDEKIKLYLKQLNYSCALTTIDGFNDKASDLFELRRIAVDDRMNQIEFIMNVAGLRCFLSKFLKV